MVALLMCVVVAALCASQFARARAWVGTSAAAISAAASGMVVVDVLPAFARAGAALLIAALAFWQLSRGATDASDLQQITSAARVIIAMEALVVLAVIGYVLLDGISKMGH